MNNAIPVRYVFLAVLVSLGLSACSSVPKEIESLEQALLAYAQASQEITVVRHAPEELDLARDALKKADRQWQLNDDQESAEHFAYLASQHIRIAQLIAERKEADRELELMTRERRNMALDLRDAELVLAKREMKELQLQVAALEAEKTERGMVMTLGDVLFDVNEATLAPASARSIAKIASFMNNHPERQAVIEGHTDSLGDEEYNMSLSLDRAMAVRNALVEIGVSAARISTVGFGESMPVASNDSDVDRQENRRVEVIFPNEPMMVSEYEE